MYGDTDGLVHIETILSQLPEHAVAKPLRTYEHSDILWGKNVHEDVIQVPEVLNTLEYFCFERDDISERLGTLGWSITFPFGIKGRFPILFIRFDNSSSIPDVNLLFKSGSSSL